MTCCIAIAEKGKVWMGADSAGVSGLDMQVRHDRKVFRNGPMVFSFTSSFRLGQLLRWSFTPPGRDPRVNVERYMATTFINAVRDCFKAGGYAKKESEVESAGCFLVGYEGQIFEVHSDYQVAQPSNSPVEGCEFAAIGCGDNAAMGALYATPKLSPVRRIHIALAAAERFSAGVRGPFIIEEPN